jgi:predicted transcriptional regulator of viral defense system
VIIGDLYKMNIEHFFFTHPIFRQEEFAALKAQRGTINPATLRQALHYYLQTKRIVIIRRGLYAVVPPNGTIEDLSVDPYLLAGKTTTDSVLAYHSALELHGVAYSLFQQFTFFSGQKVKPFSYHDHWFQPVAVQKVLAKKKMENFGVETIDRAGLEIKTTTLDRTFVDVLMRVDLSGGWEEICRSLSNISVLDVEKVVAYCLKLDSSFIAAKVGFFLEQRQGAFAVNDKILRRLLIKKPKSPQYLIKPQREPSEFIKKWNLLVPRSVLYQTWEEPSHDV